MLEQIWNAFASWATLDSGLQGLRLLPYQVQQSLEYLLP